MPTSEADDAKAIRLLNEQLKELEIIRSLNHKDPKFKVWRDTTSVYLERFLPPSSPYIDRLENLHFYGNISRRRWGSRPLPPNYVSPQDRDRFRAACQTAEESIRAALKYIGEFGVHAVQSVIKPISKGGVHYHAPVSIGNQAIATDNSTQNIGHLGDAMAIAASLEEIRGLFEQSKNLTQGQVREGLVAVDALTLQVQKPEHQRNWKSVLNWGQAVLTIADKATDLAHKLAPYTSHIGTLVQQAKHLLQ